MTFIIAEDDALKKWLAGITVTDAKAASTAVKTVVSKALFSNMAEITTYTPHQLIVGQTVVIEGVDEVFNGTYKVSEVVSATRFKYPKTNDNIPATLCTGTCSNNSARNVQVWFGFPDVELRAQSYPYITVELIDVVPSRERQSSGMMYDSDNRGTIAPVEGVVHRYSVPLPYDLVYQVTSYARNPRHDRAIIYQLLQKKFPSQYGTLEIPNELNTEIAKRHMFLDGFLKRDMIEEGRRLFRNAFTVRVVSEMTPMDADTALSTVQTVEINQTTTEIPDGLTPLTTLTKGA